jgi:hypothetical protein
MRGSAGYVKIVVLVVVIVAIVVGVIYFTSDVQRTKIDQAVSQYAHWTPENIAKDPENYLNFCEKEAEKAMLNLKASEIAIAQNRGNMESMKTTAQNKVAAGDKAIAELKDLFSKAEKDNSWPVTWQGQPRDKDWAKRQIVSLFRQIEGEKGLLVKIEDGMKRLDGQLTRVQEGRSQAQQQLAEIKTSREMLKIQKITDDLTKRLVSIKEVLKVTLNTASESTGTVSLEQLAAQQATTVDENEFKKIMGQP